MTQSEIRDFKKFMNDQDAFMVFEKTYNENRMTFNPKKLEDYLETSGFHLSERDLRQGLLDDFKHGMDHTAQTEAG